MPAKQADVLHYPKRQSNMKVQPSQSTQPKTKKQSNFKKKFGYIDIPMLTLVLLLLLFGLVMLFSASYPSGLYRRGSSFALILPQLKYAAVGVVAMLVASVVDYHILKKFAWPLMIVTMALLTVVLFMEKKNGARRWIWFNSSQTSSFQPSEIVKFALILLFASLIARHEKRMHTFQYGFFPFMVILGSIAGLLLLEPHLSATLLVMGIGISMMYSGGAALRWFGFAAIFASVALYFTVTQFPDLVPYAQSRIDNWLDPFADRSEYGYQTVQSLIAVGSGGITGRGIGNSLQKFLYLPETYNDYIFAVLCEELGMIGAVTVIILFILLLARGFYIAAHAKDKFGSMLVVGISVQIALQAFLHIAVNINAIPSTGISMPFFSSGGTSLCMLLGQVGIVLSVSRQANLPANRTEEEPEQLEAAAEEG